MALTKSFYEAVSEGNVLRIRIMMKDSLLVDPTFREFAEMEKETASIKGLYDEHDGSAFNTNKETWNDEYMNILMVEVVENFSHERIEHLKDVVRYLYPVPKTVQNTRTSEKNKNTKTNRKTCSYEEQKYRDQQQGRYIGTKVATGAVIGAVAGGVVASTAGATVVGGVVVGGVVVAGGVAIYESVKNRGR